MLKSQIATLCLALMTSQVLAQTNGEASVDLQITAETELMDHGATITIVYANYIFADVPITTER